MLQKNVLPVIIETLNIIGAQPLSGLVPSGFVTLSYYTLYEALESASGPVWIAQALDAGLLFAMLRSGFRLTRPDAPQRLFDVLHQYTVYRSVLRSLSKALTKIDQCTIDAHISGLAWGPWQAFRAIAAERLKAKDEFDTKHHLGGFSRCQAHVSGQSVSSMSFLTSLVVHSRTRGRVGPTHRLVSQININ